MVRDSGHGPDDDAGWEALSGELDRLPGTGGWHVVHLGPELSAELVPLGRHRRGFVAVEARVGESVWATSLMPAGGGALFLAVPAAVRRANDLQQGDVVTALVRLRPP